MAWSWWAVPNSSPPSFCWDGGRGSAAAGRLLDYARRHGFTPTGTLRRIYLEGPPQHRDPAKFITQVALPVAEEPEPELPVSSAK